MPSPGLRKIWVKRAGASATQVKINQDDLVDDVRDAILRKYGNSLGKTFDTPDLTLRILQRVDGSGAQTELLLGPEQDICKILDAYYPGGQKLDEALVIHVPQSQLLSPRLSPRTFPSVDQVVVQRPSHDRNLDRFAHMSSALARPMTPRLRRQQTVAAAMISRPFNGRLTDISDTDSDQHHALPIRNPSGRTRLGSSSPGRQRPVIELHNPSQPSVPSKPESRPGSSHKGSAPTTPSLADSSLPQQALQPQKTRRPGVGKLSRKKSQQRKSSKASPITPSIGSSVPPINVLIVEDNNMTLRVLERVMQRLKVRWQTAANGRIGVDKWRTGGFHLVLMDIQMPIMTGLEATQEIRRLERSNGIGVFSLVGSLHKGDALSALAATDSGGQDGKEMAISPDDKLPTADEGFFNSPTIIVALTASSLDSDRHEALAAGCNDFLTKPVDLVWMEQKIKEWGCMQALIDFNGWRKWRSSQ